MNKKSLRRKERLKRQQEFDAKYGGRSSAAYQPKPLRTGGYGRGTLK